MTGCPRYGKWFQGCRFEPRYDAGEPDLSSFTRLRGNDVPALIEALKAKTYVKDVCVRCGKEIHRNPTQPTGE